MGAVSQITNSISSALGTDGGGGGVLGGVSDVLGTSGKGGGILGGLKDLQSNPLVQTAEEVAAIYYGGQALGAWGADGGGLSSLFSSGTDAAASSDVGMGTSTGWNAAADSQAANVAMGQGAATAGTAATAAASSPWSLSSIGNVLSTPKGALTAGTDLYSIYAGQQMRQAGQQQDPMAPYRAQYAAQLNNLTSNPSSITSMPGYQAGLTAVQRGQAASGTLSSGAGVAGLSAYGNNFYNQQVQQLSGLAQAGSAGGGSSLSAQSLANTANVSAGLSLASLFQ